MQIFVLFDADGDVLAAATERSTLAAELLNHVDVDTLLEASGFSIDEVELQGVQPLPVPGYNAPTVAADPVVPQSHGQVTFADLTGVPGAQRVYLDGKHIGHVQCVEDVFGKSFFAQTITNRKTVGPNGHVGGGSFPARPDAVKALLVRDARFA